MAVIILGSGVTPVTGTREFDPIPGGSGGGDVSFGAGDSNNYVITSTGVGNEIQGEANLQFTGSLLTLAGDFSLTSGDINLITSKKIYLNAGETSYIYDNAGWLTLHDSHGSLITSTVPTYYGPPSANEIATWRSSTVLEGYPTLTWSSGLNRLTSTNLAATNIVLTDTINEYNSGTGVTIDGVLLKDSNLGALSSFVTGSFVTTYYIADATTSISRDGSNELTFTDAVTGSKKLSELAGVGNVSKVGTPVNNQIGVWTGNGTIEGDADFTWNGTILLVNGELQVEEINEYTGGQGIRIPNKVTVGADSLPGATLDVRTASGSDPAMAITNAGSGYSLEITGSSAATTQKITIADAGTNTIVRPLELAHTTSNTAAAGFGAGLSLTTEYDSGTSAISAALDAVITDPVYASGDADLSIKLNEGGSLTEQARITSGGVFQVDTIDEITAAAGVTIEGVELKDSNITLTAATNHQILLSAGATPLSIRSSDATGSSTTSFTNYGGVAALGNILSYNRYGGTYASPAAAPTNAYLKEETYKVWDGTSLVTAGGYVFQVTGAIATGDFDTYMSWSMKEGAGASGLVMSLNSSGILHVDTLNELTGSAGVTIEGVLLKDSDVTITTANYLNLNTAGTTNIYDNVGVMTFTDTAGGPYTLDDLYSPTTSFGSQYQIPFTNAATDDFDYTSDFTWTGSNLIIGSNTSAYINLSQTIPGITTYNNAISLNSHRVYSDTAAAISHNTSILRAGGTVASPAAAPTNSLISRDTYEVWDGTAWRVGLRLDVEVDGAVSSDNFNTKATWDIKEGAGSLGQILELNVNGLEYTGDHSTDQAANDRWIPDKGYVDSVAGGTGTVDTSGSPANTYVAYFTDADTISGASTLTWSGGTLSVNDTITADDATNSSTLSTLSLSIDPDGTPRTIFTPNVSDGAAAIVYTFDTANALSTDGAKLASFLNANNEQLYIDKSGNLSKEHSYTSCPANTTTNINIGTTSDISFLLHYAASRDMGTVDQQSGNIQVLYEAVGTTVYYTSDYIGSDLGFTITADLNGSDIRLNIVVDNANANTLSFDYMIYSKIS